MKKSVLCLALIGLLALGGTAIAEIGTIDDVPAATLLLPYFEVDLDNDLGVTTLFSINNASAAATIAHVTLWTDESIPSLDFDVYLTGYDVQTINIRDLFNGVLPRTAERTLDAGDALSPSPPIGAGQAAPPWDTDFPGSTGPCANPYSEVELTGQLIAHVRASHTGNFSALYGGCLGADYGDNIARGYITVDVVGACSTAFPSDPGYWSGLGAPSSLSPGVYDNILWGDYFMVNSDQNFAQGETLVHIEACEPDNGYIGAIGTGTSGVNTCPLDAVLGGDYTFYGRYALGIPSAGNDSREALSTMFATRFLSGGVFDGGTDLLVWRDSKTTPTGANGPHACGDSVAWFPLGQTDVVAFDEFENSTDLCFQGDNVSPPTGGADTCFPLETQRIFVEGGNPIADDMGVPYEFGWLFLNLNHQSAGVGGVLDPTAQAWVTTVMDAEGRFSVGFDAIKLDQANQTFQSAEPSGILLEP